MNKRILTGIQSSGEPHLGNILGAIIPALELSAKTSEPSYFFIADLHTLTSNKDPEALQENTLKIAAAWLAFGLNPEKDVFFKQSDVPEVTQLMWYLACFTPYGLMRKAHSFKDKMQKFGEKAINVGLFTYPVLMAADILLYDAEIVPVGKDQKQHLEITRDLAIKINNYFGKEILKVPEPYIREDVMTIPGIDGQKMSKSYNNYISIFWDKKTLKKKVMSIITDSTPLEEPKNPEKCNVFKIYSVVATPEEIETMRQNYLKGGYGYGHAKKELLNKLLTRFAEEREKYNYYVENPEIVEEILQKGAEKARRTALEVLNRVRKAFGYSEMS